MRPPNEREGRRLAIDAPETTASERTVTAGPDDLLAEVAEYRATTRRILRAEHLSTEARTRALVRLYGRAKGGDAPELVIAAIVAELSWDIDRPLIDTGHGDPLERRHRALRGTGYSCCPECRSPLSNEADWAYWRALRKAEIREIEAHEGAVA